MPLWILIVVAAQFLMAIVAIIDKHIVTSKKVSKPISYAFYVGVLSSLSILIFAPSFFGITFGNFVLPQISNVSVPDIRLILGIIFSSYFFIFALTFLFKAFKQADASDVVPVVGSSNAIFTFLISFIFLGEFLTRNLILGFIFLVLGTLILSHFRFSIKVLSYSIFSGIFYAIYYSVMKLMFNEYSFDQAFFWSRFAVLLAALTILLIPHYKKVIFAGTRKTKVKNGLWIVGNNILGGLAGIALLKATEMGSVTIVQALNGLQFAFLIIISVIFGRMTPETFGENNNFGDIVQKIISVSLIIFGFYLLFI